MTLYSRRLPAIAIRAVLLAMLALASLQLALLVAEALFLRRQGQGSTRGIPWMLTCAVVIVLALMLYARASSRGDRVMGMMTQRRSAI